MRATAGRVRYAPAQKALHWIMAALIALCLALAAPAAFAQEGESGGEQQIMTIKEAKALDNGAEIAIKVIVTKGLGAGKVAVEDETGAMRAKVDKDMWPDGKPVRDGTEVTIYGTLYKRGNLAEIEATKVVVN